MSVAGQSYFTENYPDYDRQNSPAKLSFYQAMVGRWISRGARLFELGTGLGNFLAKVSRDYVCLGCDPNAYAVEQTRLKLAGADIRQGSYEQIPVEPVCQAVIAWDVIEHIEQMEEALSVIHSRLAEGGCFFLVVPVYDGPLGPVVRMLDKDTTHLWKLPRHQWRQYLEQHHFEIVESGGILRKLILGRWYLHLTRPQWLLKSIGCAMYYVARKKKAEP
ncbi:MAG TPA: class I SAM-dependent methyltransferase [Anaerohalosphaeraceae bacterium]|nr:class I SAM-dependent methyltransferase [Anaerohalosphaeraceae bacterium]